MPNVLPELLEGFNEQAKEIAKTLTKHRSLFCLGRGFGEAIAREISLKIKEVSYIHAEGYNALAFKHGPLAMIDPDERTPVIMVIDKNNHFDDLKSVFEIVKNKNATMILITNAAKQLEVKGVDFFVEIPNQGILSSFFAVFVGQLISYHICLLKGYNPDKPRHLSKEVTV